MPNYDESLEEPTVLPAKIPLLLLNGTGGIAVGVATNIPPHNLREVIDGTIALIRDPEITVDGLIRYIQGPDFPDGRVHQRPGGDPLRLPDGAGDHPGQGARPDREERPERPGEHRRDRASLPGQQGEPHREDLGARQGEEDRRDRRPPGRIGPGGDPRRPRPEAGRGLRGRLEPALQAHPDGVHLRDHHAGHRPGPAPGLQPQGGPPEFPDVPQGGRHPPDDLRSDEGPGAGPYPRGADHRPRPDRRGDRGDQGLREPPGGVRRPLLDASA